MKRVLLLQPSLQPPGGGNSVAVWMIEALKRDCDVSVLTCNEVDVEEINRFYGTTLAASDFRALRLPALARTTLTLVPVPAGHLQRSMLLRLGRDLAAKYDVVMTANNEADFGRRGIQYIHFPWSYFPRPAVDLRWYHARVLLDLYYKLCDVILDWHPERMSDNVTLVNSDWTARKVRERFGIECERLYPPVVGIFPDVPWSERRNGFISLGRLSPEKELEKAVAIVAAVRERRPEVTLHIVGSVDNSPYARRIRRLVRVHADWIRFEENLPRSRVEQLLSQHRYGLHTMASEHFGIAVAEMAAAGCIPFVRSDGGQVEIVAHDRLMYDHEQDAVEKILRVMDEPTLQGDLRAHLAKRRALWSKDDFMKRIRELVARFPDA